MASAIAAYGADPQQVWEQAIQAKGGRDRLHHVQSLAVYMKAAQVMLAGPPTTMLCVFPSRYFEYQGDGFATHAMAIVVDGTANRVGTDVTGHLRSTRMLSPAERDRLIFNQLLFLLESNWLQPQLLEAKRNEVTVRAGDREFQISLDKANFPERIVSKAMPGEGKLYDYRLQHYREYAGIWLPVRVTSTMRTREWVWDADYEVDAKYNPKMFEREPNLADGPEPWRRR